MTITESGWVRYIDRLTAINETAAKKFAAFLNTHETGTAAGRKLALDYAAALVQKYGECAAAVSCEMYDAIAEASGVILPAAEPAAVASYGEVAKTVNGIIKQADNPEYISSGVSRLVKQTGVDTTMKNAIRDGAEWAWVPHGDTCAFCIMLASNGWQRASKKALKGGHAAHIHANCDCTYAIRFDGKGGVAGYNPDKYLRMYENAEGDTWQEKMNSMRREQYAEDGDRIRAQKRAAYERNKTTYDGVPKSWKKNLSASDDEVLKGTNPNYKDALPPYLFGTNDDFSNNCTNSVVAYCMRKKGYNVTANSIGECGTLRHGDRLFSAWKGRKPTKTSGNGLENILKYMQMCKDGTVLAVTVEMPKSIFKQLPGHAFIAEKKAGETVFLDPQQGRRYTKPEDLFATIKGSAMFMRVDDLELSDRGISACKGVL